MAICPIICSFYYLARALMHDVACEFACAVGCAETISANVLNTGLLQEQVRRYKISHAYIHARFTKLNQASLSLVKDISFCNLQLCTADSVTL